jgi:hypothetical protein
VCLATGQSYLILPCASITRGPGSLHRPVQLAKNSFVCARPSNELFMITEIWDSDIHTYISSAQDGGKWAFIRMMGGRLRALAVACEHGGEDELTTLRKGSTCNCAPCYQLLKAAGQVENVSHSSMVVDTGVAEEDRVADALPQAVLDAEPQIHSTLHCMYLPFFMRTLEVMDERGETPQGPEAADVPLHMQPPMRPSRPVAKLLARAATAFMTGTVPLPPGCWAVNVVDVGGCILNRLLLGRSTDDAAQQTSIAADGPAQCGACTAIYPRTLSVVIHTLCPAVNPNT